MMDYALYEQILLEKGIAVENKEVLGVKKTYGLSKNQQGIWFLQQMYPDSPAYNNPSAICMSGDIERELFEKTLQILVKTCLELRTGFQNKEGEVRQYIKSDQTPEFYYLDECSGCRDSVQLKKILVRYAAEPFDLPEDKMVRFYLIKTGEKEHYFLMNIHHIISDGWTKRILFQKIASIYNGLVTGKQGEIERNKGSYREYVAEMEMKYSGSFGRQAQDFWEQELLKRPAVLDFFIGRKRDECSFKHGIMKNIYLNEQDTQKIDSLCRQLGNTPFQFLFSVFSVFLYRYTSQKEFMVGIPVYGRSKCLYEDTVGLFTNSIPIKVAIEEESSFYKNMQIIAGKVLRTMRYQDYSFQNIVEHVNPDRDSSIHPIYQIMFQYEENFTDQLWLEGVDTTPMELDLETSQLDLSVTCYLDKGRLCCSFDFAEGLFQEQQAAQMTAHFMVLLRYVIKNHQCIVKDFPIMSMEEEHEMLMMGQGKIRRIPDKKIIGMWQDIVALQPEEAAVLGDGALCSYRQLDELSNQVSNYLKNLGAGAGRPVFLCFQNSIEYIVHILAVLKSGAMMVAVDPGYPAERIKAMSDDFKEMIFVTDEEFKEKMPKIGMTVIVREKSACYYQRESKEYGFHVERDMTQELVCIYTSGSSGKPKGVVLSEKNILNLIYSFIESYALTKKDIMLSLTGTASASYMGEILPVLCGGGSILLQGIETASDLERLLKCLDENKVTMVSTVPSMIRRINEMINIPNSLRLILSGGEKLIPADITNLSKVIIANGYGLTESGICNTYKPIQSRELQEFGEISIGKPILNNQVLILNHQLKLVPRGVKGDIYIGGDSIAKGYLNRPELSCERFINNPFKKGEQILKTGDSGYWGLDGEIYFLGRNDRQIQIRGFRVEQGEIEECLKCHNMVKDAVVSADRSVENSYLLTAYYATSDGKQIPGEELTAWMKLHLPSYMLPGAFIHLQEIPYNYNGKVDREKLRSQGGRFQLILDPNDKPRTAMEKKLQQIWEELLERDNIGVNDNFFDIGGHSLLLTKLQRKLEHITTEKISVLDFFEYSTIRSFSCYIEGKSTNSIVKDTMERAKMQQEALQRIREGRREKV